jgi:hypothetical protein
MNRQLVKVLAMVAVGVGLAGTARASDTDWGTLEGAHVCDKEMAAANASPDKWKWLSEGVKSGKGVSAECKAELDKRMQACLKDPDMRVYLNQRSVTDPNGLCYQHAFGGMYDQIRTVEEHKKHDEEVAKVKEAANAKLAAETAAREVPKATKHDAKLEKAIADAYHRDYPEGKVLKVILGNWADEMEKDAFNRITGRDLDATVVNKQPDGKCYLHGELWMQHGNGKSFSGPFSARGAGSLSKQEILCSKVEAKK